MKGGLQKLKGCCRIAIHSGIVLLFAACEKPFEPIQPNELAFSIYGHLEAKVDTQWVRVTPIRTTLATTPVPIDAVVTLEEVETGTTVVMSDSLVRYLPVNFEDEEVYAHNFFTTLPMVPGRHYRVTATRSDGGSASATVLIPVIEDPVVEWNFQYFTGIGFGALQPAKGQIRGMRHIGMLLRREEIPAACNYPISVHQQYLRVIYEGQGSGNDPHVALLEWDAVPPWVESFPDLERLRLPDCDRRGSVDMVVIASGEAWAYGELSNLRELTHPASATNIEGGLGFLAGVQRWVFPFESCAPLTPQDRCGMMFSSTSATFHGIVINNCGLPLDSTAVLLRGNPGGIRRTMTNAAGRFRYRAIDPGVPYSLTLRPPGYLPFDSEPMTFGEAAVDTIAFSVGALPCG